MNSDPGFAAIVTSVRLRSARARMLNAETRRLIEEAAAHPLRHKALIREARALGAEVDALIDLNAEDLRRLR